MTDIIKTVVGSIIDKARDVVSNKLSEGDLTNETIKKLIAREINEINKKLDALGRKDLLSSVQFLKEGLNRLLMAMQKKSMNSDKPTTSRDVELDLLTAVDDASTSQRRVNEAFTISNVLAKKFKVVSLERLKNAKKSFEDARKEATRAFANEALSIDDRIMATELRIVSRILESFLDDPDAGCSDCLLYLKALHDLSAVREMYSAQVDGKPISLFIRKKREQKVETIKSINASVLDFVAGFTSEEFRDSVNWPTIQLRNERKYEFFSKKKIAGKHAELNERRRMKARWPDTEIGTTLPKRLDLMTLITINKGIILFYYYFVLTKNFAMCASLLSPVELEINLILVVRSVLCLVTDASNWVYVLVYARKWLNSALVFAIFVFDSDGMFLKCITTDISCGSDSSSSIGVFAMQVLHGKIAVLRDQFDSRRVNFIDVSTGETYHTIFLPHPQALDSPVPYINILNDSEIMVTRSDDKAVCIYTNEGQLKQTIHLPLEETFTICDIDYRAASEEVLVLTRVSQDSESLITRESYEQLSPKELLAYRLLVYSTNGAPKDTFCLSRDSLKYVVIVRPYFSFLESEIFWVEKGLEYVRKKIGL